MTAKIRRSVPDRVGLNYNSAVIIPLFNDFVFHNSADCFPRIFGTYAEYTLSLSI